MIILANLLLAVAALLTFLVALLVADARHVGGADAMGLVVVPMLLAPRWLALAGVVAIACSRSALGWVHASRTAQAVLCLAWLGLAGAASFASVLMAHGPDSQAFKPWAAVLAVVVPGMVAAGLAIALNARTASPAVWRLAAGAVTVVVAAGGVAMARAEWAHERQARASVEAAAAERQQWLAGKRSQLQALSPQVPLRDWLPWLNVHIDELREPALAAVRARPTLEADLAAMLRGEEAPLALRFMWLWMPDPPATLGGAVHQGISGLPAWAERHLEERIAPAPVDGDEGEASGDGWPAARPVDLDDMAQAAIVLADKYRASGLDFVTPIREFDGVLRKHALPEEQLGADPTYQPRAYLETWLQRRAARAPGSHEGAGSP